MESPGSPLSELSSEDFPEDVKTEEGSIVADPFHDERPAKRQRTGDRSGPSWMPGEERADAPVPIPEPIETDISSDTEGSVPASPNHPGLRGDDEDALGQDQVTVCKWEGCVIGDLGNMDKLVEHLHEDHIGARQKKYSCEWVDCARKGIPHASGYALRAHMRSHTREKPFYCSLPECDRSFTRSDALAKHMRTVHETEALRPSDPVPKHHSSNPTNKSQRLRLVIKNGGTTFEHPYHGKPSTPAPTSPAASQPLEPTSPSQAQFPGDIHLTAEEEKMRPDQLYKLLRRQLHWAQAEGEEIKAEIEALERKRKDEWLLKELALENVMEAEHARMVRRGGVDGFEPQGQMKSTESSKLGEKLEQDIKESRGLEFHGGQPWWRRDSMERPAREEQDEPMLDVENGLVTKEDDAARALLGMATV